MKLKRLLFIAHIGLAMLLLSTTAQSSAMSFLRGHDTHSSNRVKHNPDKKPEKVVRHVPSGRSLASFGKMKNEYMGDLYNSEGVTHAVDASKYTRHTITDKPYLELKAIDGPLPEDYAALYMKLKTLISPTENELKIVIDKSVQRIYVYRDLEHLHTFKTSTGKRGYGTQTGTFKPYYLASMHYSKKYHNSPMPWSVFFNGGVAIHGTESISRLGRIASHGCIRTHPKSARRIFNLIMKDGKKNTTIIVRN